MILAGDIGGTNARLALFDVQNNEYKLAQLSIFPSRRYAGLDQIVTEFVKTTGQHPTQACFGIAGPVTNGRVEASNLPWIIEASRLADELKLPKAVLINDLGNEVLAAARLLPQQRFHREFRGIESVLVQLGW